MPYTLLRPLFTDERIEVRQITEDYAGWTPLNHASAQDQLDKAKRLLAAGADSNARPEKTGGTPMHYAAHPKNTAIVGLLLAHGADPNIRDNDGNTPLHLAANDDRLEIARLLLDSGVEPELIARPGMASRPCT